MIETFLFFIHSIALLLLGVFLSYSFALNRLSKKNCLILLGFCIFSGILQIIVLVLGGADAVRKFYPFITHLPLLALLCTIFHKSFATATAAIGTAYLCCHPAKWFGILTFALTKNSVAEYTTQIIVLLIVAVASYLFLAPYLSEIFNKNYRNVYVFSIIPTVYYLFDYIAVVYTDFWISNNRIALEFLPFLLCIVFIVFCMMYSKEVEKNSYAEHKEQIIRIAMEQQLKEFDAVKRSEHEIKILRHDMRLLLNNLSMCIENEDKETAQKLISAYTGGIEATTIKKYCTNILINYLISDFDSRCQKNHIDFSYQIVLDRLNCDEIMFSTIISNALENALNAQKKLPPEKRNIKLMIKTHGEKLLLSIKNPFLEPPVFVNGIPVSKRKGHGYGSQSISFLTERLGGNCQFTIEEDLFVLRVIIN